MAVKLRTDPFEVNVGDVRFERDEDGKLTVTKTDKTSTQDGDE